MIILNISTLCKSDLRPKFGDLGHLNRRKIAYTRKYEILRQTFFTFWVITQLPDIGTLQNGLEMQAEIKTFLTHPARALKNEF